MTLFAFCRPVASAALAAVLLAAVALGPVPAHAAANALVQSINEDVGSGTTVVELGVPSMLDVQSLLTLMRVGRDRLRYTPLSTITDSELPAASDVELGENTALANTAEGLARLYRLSVVEGTQTDKEIRLTSANATVEIRGTDTNRILIALADALGKEIKLRVMSVCLDENGSKVEKKIIVLASEPYT